MQLNIRPVPAPSLSNLTAQSGIRSVTLFFALPNDTTHNAVQVYAHTVDNFAAATLIGTVKDSTFRHDVADTTSRYYWVRSVNIYGRADGSVIGPVQEAGTLVQGADLDPSAVASAKTLDLVASSQIFQINKVGTPVITSITLTATGRNLAGNPSFTNPGGGATLTGSGSTRTLTFANMTGDSTRIRVDQDGLFDEVTIVKLREGKDGDEGLPGMDALTALLTNESHTLAADTNGAVLSWIGATTTMKVYEGIIDVSSQWTYSASPASNPALMEYTINATSGVLNVTGMANGTNSWTVDITASRSGFPSITKRFSVSKSKTGAAGADSTVPGPTGDSAVRAYCASSTPTTSSTPYPTIGANSVPTSNTGLSGTFQKTVPALSTGQYLYQCDGTYNAATNTVNWGIPYWAALKVGSLSAFSADLGTVTSGTYKTAESGKRVIINEDNSNTFRAYSSSGMVCEVGGSSGSIYVPGTSGVGPCIYGTANTIAAVISGSNSGSGWGGLFNSNSGIGLEAHSTSGDAIRITNGARAIYQSGGGDNFLRNVKPVTDNTYSLGVSGTHRWTAVYATSSTITTSDARTKMAIAPSDLGLAFINDLVPVKYKQKVAENIVTDDFVETQPEKWVTDDFGTAIKTQERVVENKPIVTPRAGVRYHYGLLSQQVRASLQRAGAPDAGIWSLSKADDEDSLQALRYEELIAPLIKAVQELSAKVTAQDEEIADLKARTISLIL